MHPLPQTGVLTFLFTDIEGSTTRWERSPDAMADALASHDALVAESLTVHAAAFSSDPAMHFAARSDRRWLQRSRP